MVEAQGNCLAVDAGHAARVPSIGHDDLRLSDVANISSAACKLMLMCLFGSIPLRDELINDILEFLPADWALHDEVHLVEGFDQRLVVVLLLELLVEVQLQGEMPLHVLSHLCPCIDQSITAMSIENSEEVMILTRKIADMNTGVLHIQPPA